MFQYYTFYLLIYILDIFDYKMYGSPCEHFLVSEDPYNFFYINTSPKLFGIVKYNCRFIISHRTSPLALQTYVSFTHIDYKNTVSHSLALTLNLWKHPILHRCIIYQGQFSRKSTIPTLCH